MRIIEAVKQRASDLGIDAGKVGLRYSPMNGMRIKEAVGHLPAMVTTTANTARVDMDDEVVVPAGGDPTIFQQYKSIYWNHMHGTTHSGDPILPVGTLRGLKLANAGSAWVVQFDVAANAFAQDVLIGIKEGCIRGTSIGFYRIDAGTPTPEDMDEYGDHSYITRKWGWFELSVTPMPCNPDAMIESAEYLNDSESGKAIRTLAERGRISLKSAGMMGVAVKKRRNLVVLNWEA